MSTLATKFSDSLIPIKRPPALRSCILSCLFYPIAFWKLSGAIPRLLRSRSLIGGGRFLHCFIYFTLGFPLTVFVSGEALIVLNENFVGEQANYRLQSDFAEGTADRNLIVPGPPTIDPEAIRRSEAEEYHNYLVQLFAPVLIHKMAEHPGYDIPVPIDYDANDDPRDNVENWHRKSIQAHVYGELTAETDDSYYLTYSLYHLKDYDHPIREMMTHWSYHDNDNEGFHIRVEKTSLRVVEVETWFHNRFLLFNLTGFSAGSEPVHGKIHTEGNTHVIVYVQPQGHGVRCAQWLDRDSMLANAKVLRYQATRAPIPMEANCKTQNDVTYTLGNFDAWYQKALGPFGHEGKGSGMFEETIELGTNPDGTAIRIGRFIAGRDYAKGSWSRPKPMWSWDDGWDSIPIFIWHFYPSLSFESHSGTVLSHHYIYSRPVQKVFSLSPDELYRRLSLKIEHRNELKWAPLQEQGKAIHRRDYWLAARHCAMQYVNYLFHALG